MAPALVGEAALLGDVAVSSSGPGGDTEPAGTLLSDAVGRVHVLSGAVTVLTLPAGCGAAGRVGAGIELLLEGSLLKGSEAVFWCTLSAGASAVTVVTLSVGCGTTGQVVAVPAGGRAEP